MSYGRAWLTGLLALSRLAGPQHAGDYDRSHDQRQGTQDAAQGMQDAAWPSRPGR